MTEQRYLAPEHDDGDLVEVHVGLDITETVTYYLITSLMVPAAVASDPEALRDHAEQNEDDWLDHLDPNTHTQAVLERCVDAVRKVKKPTAPTGPQPAQPPDTSD